MCLKRLLGYKKMEALSKGEDGSPAGLLEAPENIIEKPRPVFSRAKESGMAIMKKEETQGYGREASGNINALLGKGSEFEGKLTFEGTVRIDGKFSGEIFSDDTLIVGEGARLKAAVNVGSLVLYGEVIGDVRAKTLVEMHSPARLVGNIETPSLLIETGVVFDGSCRMEKLENLKKPAAGSEYGVMDKN